MPDAVLTGLKDASPRWVKDVAQHSTRAFGMATAASRALPDFLVVGTKRGGTTSLWNWLVAHPNVIGMFPEVRGRKSTDFFFADCPHSLRWYRSHFPTAQRRAEVERETGGRAVSGEASPLYMWDPRLCDRIHETLPDVKILMSLRDPVERAYSHFQERTKEGIETLGFEEALAAEPERLAGELERMQADPGYHSTSWDWFSYRSRGVYEPQVRRWLEVFGPDRVHVQRSEDMYEDPQTSMDAVCDFLGVPRYGYPEFKRHNFIPKSAMGDGVRADLTAFYAPHNAALETLLGRTFGWSA